MALFPIISPQPEFAFPRSYVEGIYIRNDVGSVTLVDNLLTYTVAGAPDAIVRVWFDERFIPWSSNRWTLGALVVDASYEYPTGGQNRPLPSFLSWYIPPGRFRASIYFDSWYGALNTFVPLPGAPSDYWLPPPLP